MALRPIPLFRDRLETARIEIETPATNQFVAEMSAALSEFQAGRERPAAIASLLSVMDLLYEALDPLDRAVLRPLVRLREALEDLDHGAVAPVLRHTPRSGRPPEPRRSRYLRGLCGLALEARRRTSNASPRLAAGVTIFLPAVLSARRCRASRRHRAA